jgi:hypothetical protein
MPQSAEPQQEWKNQLKLPPKDTRIRTAVSSRSAPAYAAPQRLLLPTPDVPSSPFLCCRT